MTKEKKVAIYLYNLSNQYEGLGEFNHNLAIRMSAQAAELKAKHNIKLCFLVPAGMTGAYGEDVEQRILQAVEEPITKFLDCFGGGYVNMAFRLGLKGSAIGTLVPSPPAIIKGAQFTDPRHSEYADFEKLASFVSSGKVNLYIDQEYPFTIEAVREAYQSLEAGHTRGKKVVVIDKAE